MLGALWHDIRTLSFQQGASTITQQLIKLTHLTSEKTISRKLQEIVLAWQLEKRMSKDEILTAYLNTVYFGNGAYGVGSAAQAYFSKDVGELTLAEGALLAGVIKSPSRYAPHLHPENAVERRNRILDAMAGQGKISPETRDEAVAEPLRLALQAAASGAEGWYMDQVAQETCDVLGMDVEEILSAGLHIYTGCGRRSNRRRRRCLKTARTFPTPPRTARPFRPR